MRCILDLVTFRFFLENDQQESLISEIEGLISLWKEQDCQIALFKVPHHSNEFMLTFKAEKSPEILTRLIQKEPKVKALFEKLKASKNKVLVTVMEQIL